MRVPTRRGLLGGAAVLASAAAAVVAGSLPVAARVETAPPVETPLIAACNEYLRINRAFEAYYIAHETADGLDDEDPGWAMLDPLPGLTETIATSRAVTAEEHLARAKCITFCFLPHAQICQDDLDGAEEDRFKSAMYRDLVWPDHGAVA